jgi:hypothetical protein
MTGNFVFSDSPSLTEMEYFRREFGLTLICNATKSMPIKQLEFDKFVMIASTNPVFWHNTLKKLPPSSVIFFLLGNETYEPSIYNSLNDLSCLKHVFVYNPPTQIRPLHHWFSVLGDFRDQFPKIGPQNILGVLRDSRTSRHLLGKFREAEFRYSWSPLPQGYSNSFALGLQAKGLLTPDSQESLINHNFIADLQSKFKKEKRFIFVGQETNRRRHQILSFMRVRKDSIVVTKKSGFGGNTFDGELSYVNFLLSSWFNLIPPGYFNNSNHRYTESCIAGSIPVILYQNSIDHSENENWTKILSPTRSYSFKSIVNYLCELDEATLKRMNQAITRQNLSRIEQTLKMIQTLRS